MYEDPEEATLRAVDICIEQGVLVDILRKHKAEVISMVLSSFNQEAYEEDMYETGYKEGGTENQIRFNEKLLKRAANGRYRNGQWRMRHSRETLVKRICI